MCTTRGCSEAASTGTVPAAESWQWVVAGQVRAAIAEPPHTPEMILVRGGAAGAVGSSVIFHRAGLGAQPPVLGIATGAAVEAGVRWLVPVVSARSRHVPAADLRPGRASWVRDSREEDGVKTSPHLDLYEVACLAGGLS
jgi:hypothetical protein